MTSMNMKKLRQSLWAQARWLANIWLHHSKTVSSKAACWAIRSYALEADKFHLSQEWMMKTRSKWSVVIRDASLLSRGDNNSSLRAIILRNVRLKLTKVASTLNWGVRYRRSQLRRDGCRNPVQVCHKAIFLPLRSKVTASDPLIKPAIMQTRLLPPK